MTPTCVRCVVQCVGCVCTLGGGRLYVKPMSSMNLSLWRLCASTCVSIPKLWLHDAIHASVSVLLESCVARSAPVSTSVGRQHGAGARNTPRKHDRQLPHLAVGAKVHRRRVIKTFWSTADAQRTCGRLVAAQRTGPNLTPSQWPAARTSGPARHQGLPGCPATLLKILERTQRQTGKPALYSLIQFMSLCNFAVTLVAVGATGLRPLPSSRNFSLLAHQRHCQRVPVGRRLLPPVHAVQWPRRATQSGLRQTFEVHRVPHVRTMTNINKEEDDILHQCLQNVPNKPSRQHRRQHGSACGAAGLDRIIFVATQLKTKDM